MLNYAKEGEVFDRESLLKIIRSRAPVYDKGRDGHYNLISAGIFSESVAELILGNASVILERSRRIVRQNLAVLEKWVESEPHLSFVKPEAGTTALVYYDYDIDSRTFCVDMIKKSGALVTPGDCFEEPKSMRIGYAYSDNTDDLQKGLDAISAYMRTLE